MRCGCRRSKLSCFALVRPPSTTGSVSLDGSWFALGHPVRGKLSLTILCTCSLMRFFYFTAVLNSSAETPLYPW